MKMADKGRTAVKKPSRSATKKPGLSAVKKPKPVAKPKK